MLSDLGYYFQSYQQEDAHPDWVEIIENKIEPPKSPIKVGRGEGGQKTGAGVQK